MKPQEDLKEIRQMMERSSRFLSLSGSSGVFIGVMAIAYSVYAVYAWDFRFTGQEDFDLLGDPWGNFMVGSFGLLLSCLLVSMVLTIRRTRKKGLKIWDKGSRNILLALALPMFVGAVLLLNEVMNHSVRGFFGITLLCYGLGLFFASRYTYGELRIMGLFMLALGGLAIIEPSKGLLFWTIGFGVVHAVYGA